MCELHYRRWRRHGDPTVVKKTGTEKRYCEVPGCGGDRFGHGYCNLHYKRWRKHGDPLREPYRLGDCTVDGCERQADAHAFCDMHYRRWKKYGDPGEAGRVYLPNEGACEVDACERDATQKGFCNMHYQRRLRGDTSDDAEVRHVFRGLDECIADDCEKKPKAHGLCTMHYKRWQAFGDHELTGFDETVPCDLYRIFDIDGRLLYVGISIDAKRRMWQHSISQPWWDEVENVLAERFDTRRAAAKAEERAIRSERPLYNIKMNR